MKITVYLEKLLKYLSIALFTALVSVVSGQILSRFFTGRSFAVVEELSMFLLAWCTFVSTAYTARKKAHVRVEYFVNRFLSEKQRDILSLILNSAMVVMLIICIKAAFGFVKRQMKIKMVVLPVSKGMMYLSFPVGMVFLTIFLIDDCVELIQKLRGGRTAAGEEMSK